MPYFQIEGSSRLSGEISVNGAKNAALKFLAASLLCDGVVTLTNMPNIEDVRQVIEVLKSLGALVTHDIESKTVVIDPRTVTSHEVNIEHARKVRTSIMLVGPLLIRFGKAITGYPGGDVIGRRPIDLYLNGFGLMGARVDANSNSIEFSAPVLRGFTYVFPIVSVVATETFMMTATRAEGTTVLKNAAQEPEIVALAEFLNSCGARITGAGTSTIVIEGVPSLSGGVARMIPDRIEAGTFIIMGAITRSNIRITDCNPEHLETVLAHLAFAGAPFEVGDTWVETKQYDHVLRAVNIKTHEYPGFMTDIQAPFTVLLTQAEGLSMVHETIWEGRLFYTDLLNRMGANIILCDPHRAIVQGVTPLVGRKIESPDIRAGIAMVLAGLIAQGTTIIQNIGQIDRGYENIDARLRSLGARIERIID